MDMPTVGLIPRVVSDQRAKFQNDELFRKSEVGPWVCVWCIRLQTFARLN